MTRASTVSLAPPRSHPTSACGIRPHFGLRTCCLRGGCLTGPNHSGVELHGFLSFLIKCNAEGRRYKVFGYKGKQVRDNIHSLDVARFMHAFCENPRSGEVYNIGGGRDNSCSILEAFKKVEALSGKAMKFDYLDENRIGDHICYLSDLTNMRTHYPDWDLSQSLDDIFEQIYQAWCDGRAERPSGMIETSLKHCADLPPGCSFWHFHYCRLWAFP